MILRLEINEIGNVIGCRALSFTRVAQTRAGCANRFFFAAQSVAIESSHFEVIEKQRGAVFFQPLPVIERSGRQQFAAKPLFWFVESARASRTILLTAATALFELCLSDYF